MPTITLDEINDAVSARYEPVVIDLGKGHSVTLTQALRLPKEKRKAIAKAQDAINDMDQTAEDAEEQVVAHIEAIIRLAATKETEANALFAKADGDLALLSMILETYGKATQLPEA